MEWKAIWSLGGPPELHYFLWRSYSGSLATSGRLFDRHIAENGLCSLCGDEQEKITHTLFLYLEIARVWKQSPFKVLISEVSKISFSHILSWLMERLDTNEMLEFEAIM